MVIAAIIAADHQVRRRLLLYSGVLLFSQSGTFGATFAITDTAPDATGPDTTGLDSDRSRRPRRWTIRSSRCHRATSAAFL